MHSNELTAMEIENLLIHTRSKGYKDLRDRAAYMHVTAAFPTHLRSFFTRALVRISSFQNCSHGDDDRWACAGASVLEEWQIRLGLADHPMVRKVGEFRSQGYVVTVSHGANERRSFSKIFMSRGTDQIVVKSDGSVLDHWPLTPSQLADHVQH